MHTAFGLRCVLLQLLNYSTDEIKTHTRSSIITHKHTQSYRQRKPHPHTYMKTSHIRHTAKNPRRVLKILKKCDSQCEIHNLCVVKMPFSDDDMNIASQRVEVERTQMDPEETGFLLSSRNSETSLLTSSDQYVHFNE